MEIVPERSLVPLLVSSQSWLFTRNDAKFVWLTSHSKTCETRTCTGPTLVVMVSAMEVQREEVRQILSRASRLGRAEP
jgi:hypothetical protein